MAQRRPRPPGGLAVKVALDVSAVPAQVAGAGRYVVELAAATPARDVTTTLVTRRDDAERWGEVSPARRWPRRAQRARALGSPTRPGSSVRAGCAKDADLWHGPHYTMPRRDSTPTVVTIHDLTFFTNPEWHERAKVAFFRRAIAYSAQHARVLVSVSDFSARALEELVPAHAPVVVAPLGRGPRTVSTDTARRRRSAESSGLGRRRALRPLRGYRRAAQGTRRPARGLQRAGERGRRRWSSGSPARPAGGRDPSRSHCCAHPYRVAYPPPRLRRRRPPARALPAGARRRVPVARRGFRPSGPRSHGVRCVGRHDQRDGHGRGRGRRRAPRAPSGTPRRSPRPFSSRAPERRATVPRSDASARARAERFTWDACVDQHLVAYELALGV